MVTTRSKTKSLPPARVLIPRDESEEPDGDEYQLEIRAPKRLRTKVKKEDKDISPVFGLMDLPHELLLEASCHWSPIASHTFPGDLISLSRTSKHWRELLMKRAAEKTWLFAESNIPELPAYPWSNMSPVKYATLLFTRSCTMCGEATTIGPDPYLMVRLCNECRETELVELVGRESNLREPEKLVGITTMMTFRKKNSEKRPRGSGSLKYCLRRELEEVRATYRELAQPGCEIAFLRWKTEVKDELNLRREFATTLMSFLRLVENTRYDELEKIKRERNNEQVLLFFRFFRNLLTRSNLFSDPFLPVDSLYPFDQLPCKQLFLSRITKRLLALGYAESDLQIHYSLSNKWRALVEQPRALSDRVWENILPKVTAIVEANKAQAEADAKLGRKLKRQAELHRLLREFKLETHPLADMVRALGYDSKLPEPATSNGAAPGVATTPACVLRVLNTYPFPDIYTALEWPFFKTISATDMSLEDVKVLVDAHHDEIEAHAKAWRNKIECGLTQKVLLDESLPPLNDVVKVAGSTDPTAAVFPLTQLLLRADTIFTTSKDAEYDEKLLHYPLFIPTKDKFWSYGWPQVISVSQYVFHTKACEVARALLKDLGKPDASGLEMDLAGKAFRCGRCAWTRPVIWDVILKHYLHEHQISAIISSSTPRFKTRHPIMFENTHSLEHGGLVLDGENEASNPISCDPVYCLPCKNYGRMFVGVEEGQMGCHLESVHNVLVGVQNVHWGLVSDSGTFLEAGGAWRTRWDQHYDELKQHDAQDIDEGEASSDAA